MLKDFFNEIGADLSGCGKIKKEKTVEKQKDDFAPRVWEVREKLREIVEDQVCAMEEKMYGKSKYPILVKGELDEKLSMKTERKKHIKKEKEEKDKKYVESAKQRVKNARDKSGKSQSESAKVAKQIQSFYQQTRNNYHQHAAPTRFHIESKFKKK